MSTGQYLWGLSNGVSVLGIAGAFWLGLGLGPAARALGIVPWLIVLAAQVVGIAAFSVSAFRLRRRSGFRASQLQWKNPQTRRIVAGFGIVGLLEAMLVGAAVLLCLHFRREDQLWPAIGVAVSLHFAPLAMLFKVPEYFVTGVVGTLISITVLVAPLGPSRLVWLGAGMSVLMWISAAYLFHCADALAARSLSSSTGHAN